MLLPISCYLIEHPVEKILIDTGWDSKYTSERPNIFSNSICRPVIKQRESVDCKLKGHGIVPSDIDGVFLSHMDFDHTSGLRLVKDAGCVMAAKSLDWICQCAADPRCLIVAISHDPAVKEQVIEL